jgi:hypothetical protein
MDYKLIRLPPDEKVTEWERHTIQLKKFMLTIVWNQRRLHLIKVLEKGRKSNAAYDRAESLSPLSEWSSTEPDSNDRKLIAHAGNAPPHVAKVSNSTL